jgi:hypothetical protein
MDYSEGDLIRVTGISKQQMREIRKKLEEGAHWFRKPSKGPKTLWPVFWTRIGVDNLCLIAGVDNPELEQELAAVEPPKQVEGIVKAKFANPRIIACDIVRDKGYERVNVLVKDSRNFVLGMVVPLRSDGKMWIAAKHPRFGGRW